MWDPRRKVWSDSWKEFLFDFEIKMIQKEYEAMNVRVSDKLRDPKKVIDIINFGIENPELATNCLGEVLHQLYHTNKHHVLIAMDGYNDWMN